MHFREVWELDWQYPTRRAPVLYNRKGYIEMATASTYGHILDNLYMYTVTLQLISVEIL